MLIIFSGIIVSLRRPFIIEINQWSPILVLLRMKQIEMVNGGSRLVSVVGLVLYQHEHCPLEDPGRCLWGLVWCQHRHWPLDHGEHWRIQGVVYEGWFAVNTDTANWIMESIEGSRALSVRAGLLSTQTLLTGSWRAWEDPVRCLWGLVCCQHRHC